MQAGDVTATWANIDFLKSIINYRPQTEIKTGIENFVNWYMKYYENKGVLTDLMDT